MISSTRSSSRRPPACHRESVVPALDRGLAVFVEKPLARTVEDAVAIAAAAGRAGTVCAVGYQWRAAEAATDLARRLEDQRIAMLLSQGVGITQARPWWGDSRLSGGLVYERASHHIDLQRMVAGEIRAVRATRGDVPLAGAGNGGGTEDVIAVELRFDSGAIGTVLLGWVGEDYPPVQSLRVVATDTVYDLALDPRLRPARPASRAARATNGRAAVRGADAPIRPRRARRRPGRRRVRCGRRRGHRGGAAAVERALSDGSLVDVPRTIRSPDN